MAQCLGVHTALAEDLSLISSVHTSGGSQPPMIPTLGHQAPSSGFSVYLYSHSGMYTYKRNLKKY